MPLPAPSSVVLTLLSHALRFTLFLAASHALALTGHAVEILSPNQKLRAIIAVDASGRLQHSLLAGNAAVLLPSSLGIVVNGDDLGAAARLGTPVQRIINETYPVLGVHAVATNRCRDYSIPVTGGTGKTPWVLEVRVFDDGLAVRYRIAGSGERTINGEATTWAFPSGGTFFYQTSKSRDYEQGFSSAPLATLPPEQPVMADSTLRLPGLGYVMATEANLVAYSDLVLQPAGPDRLKAIFPHDAKGWKHTGEIVSPWRVTLFAANLNDLVNTDLLRNLCPAPAPELARASWIVPGRANWHWMVGGKPKLDEQRKWVDWTRDLGWEYYLIDDGWAEWTDPAAGRDAWGCLQEVVAYAKTKGVRIWAWVHTREVTDPAARLAYFKKARESGLAGLKIDFMGPPSAGWVKWYDETLRDAAAARLMVNFHGCVKPTGRERTWPHELTREAIRGRENGKQPGDHDTILPFTRFVQGHADYTPTDWRGNKLRGNSYAHELAQAIVYTSPLLCYSGAPENYLTNEALDVLKSIPATWDETIVLPGSEIGETAAFARRKGEAWFIGVVNGPQARTLEIPLTFLAGGVWSLDALADSPARTDAWIRGQRRIQKTETLRVELRVEGGFVARLTR